MSSIYRRDSVIVVVRPVDERCNLSCEYCNAAVHANSRAIMSRETLERIIVQASKPDYRFVQFVWHGGEPLLAGLDFYKAVLELQQQHFGGNFAAGRCENVIQTNGLLLSTNTLDFLEKGGFWIGTSIDGPDLSANRYRFQGRGAETVLKKTLDACRSVRARGLSLLTISVIHDANFYRAEEMYHFFCKLDVSKVSFNPRFLRGEHPENTTPHQFEHFLRAFLAARGKSAQSGGKWLRVGILDDIIEVSKGAQSKMCFFSGQCHKFLSVTQDGEIYASCTDALGAKLGSVYSNGLDECITGHTGGPNPQIMRLLRKSVLGRIGPGCPKHSVRGYDIFLPIYRRILADMEN